MYREKLRRPTRGLLVGSGVILGGVLLALIFPTVNHGAMAADDLSEMSTSVNTNLTTLVRSSIAVALSSRVELDVTPRSTGAFSTSSADLKVTTNNTTGYAVYLQTADDSSELKATNPHVEASIGPVEGTMSEGSYSNNLNQWGYAISVPNTTSSMIYKAVPQAGDEAIVRTTGISREDDYDLSFAIAVGSDLPAGLYTNQLLVSVVANPIEVRSLNDITYMQDMTAEICAITFEGETKQLVDSRDGKSYWVAKLKDGNCWMTENLGVTFGEGEGMVSKLTSNDSDLSEGREWVPEATDITTRATIQGNGNSNGVASWSVTDLSSGAQQYYQFNTATAGTGQKVTGEGQVATDSICPKGWRLPLSGDMNKGKNGSFQKLLVAYNVPSDSGEILLEEPLNFTKVGIITSEGVISYLTAAGLYWSSVVAANGLPYLLDFNTRLADPSAHGYPRHSGLTVRCVAR